MAGLRRNDYALSRTNLILARFLQVVIVCGHCQFADCFAFSSPPESPESCQAAQ
jgi:hypothetical protein